MKTPEDKVLNQITRFLDSLGVYYERRQAMGIAYKKGLPDLFCVLPNGIHIEIEVKAEGGSPSSMQIQKRQMFEEMNIPYVLAYSVEDVIKKMEEVLSSSK